MDIKEAMQTLFLVWVLFMSSLILVDVILIFRNIREIREDKEGNYGDNFEGSSFD